MKRPLLILPVFPAGAAIRLALVTALAGLAGCGRDERETARATPAPAEVRGEPIKAPAQAPAAELSKVSPTAPPATNLTAAAKVEASPASNALASATGTATVTGAAVTTNVAGAGGPVGTPANALAVGFDKLGSFQYALPEGPVDTNVVAATQAASQIPASIKALNNQFVSLKGFMLPLKVEKGLVTELLIMRDQSMCCYGTVPRINEWVSVKMGGTGVKPIMDQAVTLFGKLKVGEMYENGYLVGIYALDGDRMAGPLDL